MRQLIVILLVLLSISTITVCADSKTVVAIQPLGSFDAKLLEQIKQSIEQQYLVDIVVLPEKPLPPEAFYSPRSRYRAEKLIVYLTNTDTTHSKVIGLTTKDISTTKGEFADWGIFGLAFIGKRGCVVSTHRLSGNRVSKTLFQERLTRVVCHELGHTFGLDHCPNQGCIMEDCKGTVYVVDNYKGFCAQCQARLRSAKLIK